MRYLSDTTRCLLRGAAVAGDPFDPELAAAAAAFDGTSALEAVDELLRLDLIRETDVPRRFRFRHPLVRRAVYESAPGGWRLGAHERCADALAARGVGPEERAHHVERAGRQGTRRPSRHCATPEMQPPTVPQKARPTGSRSPSDCSPTTPPQGIASRSCSRAQERWRRAGTSPTRTPRCAKASSSSPRMRSACACGSPPPAPGSSTCSAATRTHTAVSFDALESLEDADSAEAAALMIELAMDGVYRMEFEQIEPWARRALEIARPLGDRPLTASAAAVLAWGAGLCGRVSEAETYRAEAAALVDSLTDQELALRLDAAINLAGAELYLDRFHETAAHAERVVAVARATGQPAVVVFAFMLLAWARMLNGELADGRRDARWSDRRGQAARQRTEPGRAAPQSLTHSCSRRATQNLPSSRPRRASS